MTLKELRIKIKMRILKLKADYELVGGNQQETEARLWELYNLLFDHNEADRRCRMK